MHQAAFEAWIDGAHLRGLVKAVGGDRLGDARHDFAHVRVVDAQHRHAVEGQPLAEIDEGGFQALEIMAVGVHVIGVDIGDDRDHRRQIQERGIGFVGLGHQKITLAKPRIGAGGGELAADDVGRIHPRFAENAGDQAGGGGLAVGAGNGDAALQPHQFGQHQCARHDGDFLLARGDDFGIGFLHGSRSHHRIGVGDVFAGMVVMDARAQTCQPLRHRVVGQIGAGYCIAQVQQHLGDAAHADAADAHEVDMFDGVFHRRWTPLLAPDVDIWRSSRPVASRKREPCSLLGSTMPTK